MPNYKFNIMLKVVLSYNTFSIHSLPLHPYRPYRPCTIYAEQQGRIEKRFIPHLCRHKHSCMGNGYAITYAFCTHSSYVYHCIHN